MCKIRVKIRGNPLLLTKTFFLTLQITFSHHALLCMILHFENKFQSPQFMKIALQFILIAIMALSNHSCTRNKTHELIKQTTRMLSNDSALYAYTLLKADSANIPQRPQTIFMTYMLALENARCQADIPSKSANSLTKITDYFVRSGNSRNSTLSLYLLASCYHDMNLNKKALECAHAVERQSYHNMDSLLQYKVQLLISRIYAEEGHFDKSKESLGKAYHYAQESKSLKLLTQCMFEDASRYLKEGDAERSMALCLHCIKLNKQQKHCERGKQLRCLQLLCQSYINTDSIEKAQNILTIISSEHSHTPSIYNYNHLEEETNHLKAEIFYKLGFRDSAEACFKQNMESSAPLISYKAFKCLSDMYHKEQNHKAETEIVERFHKHSDSLLYAKWNSEANMDLLPLDSIERAHFIKKDQENWIIAGILLILIMASTPIAIYKHKEKVKLHNRYDQLLTKYITKKEEIRKLKSLIAHSESASTNKVEEELDKEIKNVEQIALAMPEQDLLRRMKENLFTSDIALIISQTLEHPKTSRLGEELYVQAYDYFSNLCPHTIQLLNKQVRKHSEKNFRICILLLFGIKPKLIAKASFCEVQNITNIKAKISQDIFQQATAKHFVERMLVVCKV